MVRIKKMAKPKIKFVCQECGYESLRWLGKCPNCDKFNTLIEEMTLTNSTPRHLSPLSLYPPQPIIDVEIKEERRILTPWDELNRVLGGGIVLGSLILLGGEPGIGKSTLILQTADKVAEKEGVVLYVSGEESPQQIRLRAERLGIKNKNLYVLSETNLENIEKYILNLKPTLAIIDSIQTVYQEDFPSAPGSVSQVRECSGRLMHLAKREKIPTFLIGHVTKEGVIAGPRVLEHIVDTVLYFEGEKQANFRILRAIKNRFGATDELGVFEMTDAGLFEVNNPSQLFLSQRAKTTSGSCVVCALEGTRPLLLELQALVTPNSFGIPRRQTIGADYNRVNLILAVLEKKVGLNLSHQDVYINLAGGIRIQEPALDLGIAVAVASSLQDIPVDEDLMVFGEIGLTGEVRPVSQGKKRIKEAIRLGFKRCVLPEGNQEDIKDDKEIKIFRVQSLKECLNISLKR